jgi:ABC-type phosphate transport system substrate-binding protein
MTFLSARRLALLVAATAALLAVVALPSTAGAVTKPDLGVLCSGSNIEGLGSTFQAPIDYDWTGENTVKKELTSSGFNVLKSKFSCEGTEEKNTKGETIKTTGKPTVRWNQSASEFKGSGSCLKEFGANGGTVKTNVFPICGTDEAPSRSVEAQMEAHSALAEKESIESIPVLQGAVAILVHLPKGCTASGEPVVKTKAKKIGRLALDQSTIEGVYRGTIKTWKELVAAQGSGHGKDSLSCTGGAAEEEMRIHPVVRVDKSGTTHIFKEFLAQVNATPFKAEAFNEINNGGKLEQPCKEAKAEEEKTWSQVGEGCENQRWPAAAEVTRNAKNESGNPGVVNQVNEEESTIGYADLAVAREMKFFSSNTEGFEGGETKALEKHQRFWTYLQQNPAGATAEYAEPSTLGDNAKLADSNCGDTVYIAKEGEVVPPPSTRDDWSQVKGAKESKTYSLCGLTYLLAYRAYFNYLNPIFGTSEAESKTIATTADNFMEYAVNAAAGGKEAATNRDYEKLPANVKKIAENGIKEIGNKVA